MDWKETRATPINTAFLLVESFTHLALSCALEPLRIANFVAGETLYTWTLLSEHGSHARCSNGVVTLVDSGLEPLARDTRLIVVSGLRVQEHVTPGLLSYLRRTRAHGTRIGAICSGSYVLARAGFLDGQDAAIHWAFHDLFDEKFPDVRLRRSVFVADQRHVTASGGAAAADLMLHLIAQEQGIELATAVADQMVYNAPREGTSAQRLSVQSRHGMRNPRLVQALRIIEDHVDCPLTPAEIAEELGISTRQLERLFGKYLKTSPKRYIMEARLQRAWALLSQTEDSVSEIAMACGFNSTSHFTKVYRAHFGRAPLAHRTLMH